MTEHIVIVGGGTGGTVLANRLADKLDSELDSGDVRVTMVTDSRDHVYKPIWLYVPFGKKTPDDARRPVRELVDRDVDIVYDRVTGVDTDAKRLSLADGVAMDYDYLTLSMGVELVPDEVPGLQEGGHHFYGEDGAVELRDALADFTEGHLVLSVVGTPHMCPAAPLEFVFMADDWFRQRGVREQVDITYTYPIQRVHGKPTIAEWAAPRMDERDIGVETFFNVESVDADSQVLQSMEGDELHYDLLVTIPPHDGVPMIREAGLGDDGWVAVDRNTLEAKGADDVFALGDATDVPAPKAGSAAHYQAGVVADRLTALVHGGVPTATYDGKVVCFLEAGMDEATFVSFDYANEPYMRPESRPVHWAKLAYNESYWLTARGLL